ncbi:SDR family NAD(P)-dependent oxidoreductase [Variovorax sp. GB1P17]|uniref:SDR family NAD(P)-dependent oxidoreductase n=1 Tax=Variovorax sp. GB1P17 TaxID=3443740 RepID=UPI003F48623E
MTLQGKIAVVTGGANGIGHAAALRLARDGADIALLDRDEAGLRQTAEDVRALGRQAETYAIDCTSEAAVREAFAGIDRRFGRVDILFNNVGQGARENTHEFLQADLASIDFLFAVNLKTCVLCSQQVVAQMRERRSGKIINVTSEAAVNGVLRNWDYAAVKAGVIGFTRALAREMAPFQVNVNVIGPGATRTRAIEQAPKDLMDKVIAGIPMQRIAEPEEIASVVSFFAGDASNYVTGQTLLVNGGNWML